MYENLDQKSAVADGPAVDMAEAIARFDRSSFMLHRYEALAKAIRDDNLDRGALKVFASLIGTLSYGTRTSWVGRQTIASLTGMSVKSVSNYLAELRKENYIVSERRPTPQANGRVLMHYTLSILSPDEIEAAVNWAVRCIQGDVNPAVSFPLSLGQMPCEFPPGQELGAGSSRQDRNSLPVGAGTQVGTSRPHRNEVPIPTGTRIESSRQDGRSNINTTSITKLRARGEGGAEGEFAERTKRGTRLPENFVLPKSWGNWALKTFSVTEGDVRTEAQKFKNHFIGASGSNARKCNWEATWHNWCFRAWPRRQSGADGSATLVGPGAQGDPELRRIRAITGGDRP